MKSQPFMPWPQKPKQKEKSHKEQPKVFHFSYGNSENCHVVASIVACNKNDAIKIFKAAIKANNEIRLKDDETRRPYLGGVEWLNIHLNPDMITKDNITKVTPLNDGVHPPDQPLPQ